MRRKEKKGARIADLYESTSKYGNRYFYGRCESGARVLLRMLKGKKNEHGEQKWELFIGE